MLQFAQLLSLRRRLYNCKSKLT